MTQSLAQLSKGALNDLSGVFAAMREDALDGLIEEIVKAKRIVVFGLVAWLISLYYPSRRKSIHTVTSLLTLWVGLSRLFLGFHWPSDVLGGFVIGLILLGSF